MAKSTTKLVPIKRAKQVSMSVVVKKLEKQAAPLIRKLDGFKVKTKEDYEKSYELLKELKDVGKAATAELNKITDPSKEAKKQIEKSIKAANSFFEPFFTRLTTIEAEVKEGMQKFQLNLETKKDKLAETFERSGNMKATTFMKKEAELTVDKGKRMVWKAVCIDESKTPREYLIPDFEKIKKALKDGETVKGWEWKQEPEIAIR